MNFRACSRGNEVGMRMIVVIAAFHRQDTAENAMLMPRLAASQSYVKRPSQTSDNDSSGPQHRS